jgi:hypothetical protein
MVDILQITQVYERFVCGDLSHLFFLLLSENPIWCPSECPKAVSNMASKPPSYSTLKLVLRYGPLQMIFNPEDPILRQGPLQTAMCGGPAVSLDYIVSLVQWVNICFLPQRAAPTHTHWRRNFLLAPSCYIGDPDMIIDHWPTTSLHTRHMYSTLMLSSQSSTCLMQD